MNKVYKILSVLMLTSGTLFANEVPLIEEDGISKMEAKRMMKKLIKEHNLIKVNKSASGNISSREVKLTYEDESGKLIHFYFDNIRFLNYGAMVITEETN
ncbi:hypothetical protein [Flammeovirga kamogawensis]|uniref:Uncharacterized protein n=1 Tax=Flammeovirga kamogawensis TaxID=373891 RepID=A0ABX8H3M8_9BACT|nr:hypothetical protein [Flammeovirga kamogawensis]MBB6460424.1 hypothetical protein [Flammeovirga kamogawensis]QWG10229.1 hypothetical protein KM029_21340 [Flammeovirga kamogawensis]TRX64680.1 hypothetical protein EO216_19265 [Flammeovirga kamogawensis]